MGVRSRPESELELRDFYAATYSRLVGTLALAAGSRGEAEDVVQEAFIRLIARWAAVRVYDDPEAWVRLVAFRLLSNRLRRARTAATALLRMHSAPAVPASDRDQSDLVAALRALPLAQRQVVVLHHLYDLPVDEVAHQLGISSGTAKSRLSRARAALAPLLQIREDDHA